MIEGLVQNLLGKVPRKYIKENFSKYTVDIEYKNFSKILSLLTEANYRILDEKLKSLGYKWNLIINEYSYSASQDSYQTLFIDEDIDDIKDIKVSFDIHKAKNKIIIINDNSFNDYLSKLNLESLVTIIGTFDNKFVLENNNFEIEIDKNSAKRNVISKQCNFKNSELLLFNPSVFYFNNLDGSTNSMLDDTILKLSLVYSLIFICDSSQIKDNRLFITLSGNKTFTYILNFKDHLKLNQLGAYYKIFEWIYSEENKVEDKLGLSKNIISAYLKDENIEIPISTFNSILSAYQIYIKGDINKYFEARNKIIEQVESTVKKINNSLETFFSNFQKSTLVFISFFLSVFLSKVFKQDDLSKIFNKQTSQVALAFVSLSVIYLVFSIWILKLDKKRVKERYTSVKKRYGDILIEEDMENILKGDFEYNSEMEYFKDRICIYKWLWIISLVVFVIILFITSDFLTIPFIEEQTDLKY